MNVLVQKWSVKDCYSSDSDMLRLRWSSWGRAWEELGSFRVLSFTCLFPNRGGFTIEILLWGHKAYRSYYTRMHPEDYQDLVDTTYSFPMRWRK